MRRKGEIFASFLLKSLQNLLLFFANLAKETDGQFHQHSTSSFYARRSEKHTKNDNFTGFFVLLGLALVKAARRMWMKLTPKAAKEVTEFQFRFLRSK